jgi:hypothetical protein
VATVCTVVVWLVLILGPSIPRSEWIVVVLAGLVTAILCHEMGHLLCARMLKVPVRAVYLGGPPALISFSAGRVLVHLGLRLRGRVAHDPAPVGASAAITAAGPAVNLMMAGIAVGVARHDEASVMLALIWGWLGIVNLVPLRTPTGRRSDGANLLRAIARRRDPAEVQAATSAVDRLERLDGLLTDQQPVETQQGWHGMLARLAAAGRVNGLVAIRDRLKLQEDPATSYVHMVHEVEYHLLTVPGLPREIADIAAQRVEWVLAHSTEPPFAIRHTLALARLRQGQYAMVEPLCANAIAAELAPGERAVVLATIALARRATGVPYQPILDEARALDPDATLIREAAAP